MIIYKYFNISKLPKKGTIHNFFSFLATATKNKRIVKLI